MFDDGQCSNGWSRRPSTASEHRNICRVAQVGLFGEPTSNWASEGAGPDPSLQSPPESPSPSGEPFVRMDTHADTDWSNPKTWLPKRVYELLPPLIGQFSASFVDFCPIAGILGD